MANKSETITIVGVTSEGKKFRPSDWAERLTTVVAKQGRDHRMVFNPKVAMAVDGGINSVVVDATLEADDPDTYDYLFGFGKANDLQMCDQEVCQLGKARLKQDQ